MADPLKDQALAAARALEKRGSVDAAVEAYLAAGAPSEAARMLSAARRFGDAGALLLRVLGVEPKQMAKLDPEGRKLALTAAICLSRASQTSTAVEIFLALGDRSRAAEALEKAGDGIGAARLRASADRKPGSFEPALAPRVSTVGGAALSLEGAQRLEASGKLEMAMQAYVQLRQPLHAARVAQAIGKTADAAQLYAEAGEPYEAATAYLAVGDTGKALDNFVRVPRADKRYRSAATEAIRVATGLGVMDFQVEHFLARYLAEAPQDGRDLESLYLLSKLYEKQDLLENAKEALKKVIAAQPGYRDATTRLATLEEQTRPIGAGARQLQEDTAFRSADRRPAQRVKANEIGLAELPDLPALPGLPPRGQPPAAQPSTVARRPTMAAAPAPASTPPARPPSAPQAFQRRVTSEVEQIANQVSTSEEAWAPGPASRPPSPPSGATLFEIGKPAAAAPPPAPAPAPPAAPPPPATVESLFAQGAVINERYRLEQKIGQGGMAMVFRAADLELGETVAIKVFTQTTEDPQLLARFKLELKLSRQLVHPNIVRLYDIGVVQRHRFITMELLRGGDLKARLGKPLELAEGLAYLVQAAAGLQAAHDQGIFHRDVKPENFFVTEDEVLKVMDFGIAKQGATPGMTVAGMLAGTPEYMAPEQINNFSSVTGAADLYALGVVAYEMFTGQVPFTHPDLMPLLMMHLQQPPRPPTELNPQLPRPLEAIILRLLQKEPEARYASGRELIAALNPLRARLVRSP